MREFKLVLPLTDNSGERTDGAHNALMIDLVSIAGGFTAIDGIGHWANAGKLYAESVRTYHVAAEASQESALKAALVAAGQMARQESVYLVSPYTGVAIVSCKAASLAVAA